jgi:hypothetical protein
MKRLNCCLLVLGAAFCAVLFAGCSGGSTMGVEYVEGLVTMDGQPVPEATVMFVPVTEGEGLSATGMTDANGIYKLTASNLGGETAPAGGGTKPGEYYVGVIKSVSEEPMSEEEAHEQGIEYVAPSGEEVPPVTHVVPVKYNNPKESGVKVTVKAGKNDLPIALTSDGAPAPE